MRPLTLLLFSSLLGCGDKLDDDTGSPHVETPSDDTSDTDSTGDSGDSGELDEPESPLYALCSGVREYDVGRDGQLEERWHYEHDEWGNRAVEELDLSADGQLDQGVYQTYEEDRLLLQEIDSDGDGLIDQVYTLIYDAQDRQELLSIDSDNDGLADELYVYSYNADDTVSTIELDVDADEFADFIYTYTYDDQGRMIELVLTFYSGTVLSRTTQTWSGDTGLVVEEDTDGDGTINVYSEFVYNEDGTIQEWSTESYGTGTECSYTYSSGALSLLSCASLAHGVVQSRFQYEYFLDASGRADRIEIDTDQDLDGSYDDQGTTDDYTWTCPA